MPSEILPLDSRMVTVCKTCFGLKKFCILPIEYLFNIILTIDSNYSQDGINPLVFIIEMWCVYRENGTNFLCYMADLFALKVKKVLKKLFKIHFNNAFLSMPLLPEGLLPSGLTTKISYIFSSSPIHVLLI